jgi:hypothetical protein
MTTEQFHRTRKMDIGYSGGDGGKSYRHRSRSVRGSLGCGCNIGLAYAISLSCMVNHGTNLENINLNSEVRTEQAISMLS